MKVLSLCIPSYNMEAYLGRCLDSLLAEEVIDKLEIIIVNDGSKDRTLEIANAYRDRYPQSVVVVDKPNGHYGSTVNAALKVATGRYFRLLDADDWFNTQTLIDFVKVLEEHEADCFVTRYSVHYEGENKIVEQPAGQFSGHYSLDTFHLPEHFFMMHCLTWQLELLKRSNYRQTEGICYTDSQFVCYPMRNAKTIYFFDRSLYQYHRGRSDQSVSRRSVARNFHHYERLLEGFHTNFMAENPSWNCNALDAQAFYIYHCTTNLLRSGILYNEANTEREATMRKLFAQFAERYPKQAQRLQNHRLYIKIWHRWPRLGRWLLAPCRKYYTVKFSR